MKTKQEILEEFWKPSSPEVKEDVYRALRLELEVDKRDVLAKIVDVLTDLLRR